MGLSLNHLLLSITTITLTLTLPSSSRSQKMKPLSTMLEVEVGEMPTPKIWPEQFHALLVLNDTTTSELSVDNLWYDWRNDRNLNLIQYQLGKLAHDVEYNNGTLFYYFLGDDSNNECRVDQFEVGIPRRNWLDGASYLGQTYVDGFLCNVWNKIDFIWYYEDVLTKRPVQWFFFNGLAVHVMTFEVGAVLEDSEWEAPVYCFDKELEVQRNHSERRRLLRSIVGLV